MPAAEAPGGSSRPTRRWSWLPRRRLSLGAAPTAMPTLVFIASGIALGPHAMNLLSRSVLDRLDVIVSAGLAVMGVFVGLGLVEWSRNGNLRTLGAGLAASGITIAIVAAGTWLMLAQWGLSPAIGSFVFAALAALGCSVSAAARAPASGTNAGAIGIADVDDVPLVVLGTVLIAWLSGRVDNSVTERLLLTIGAGAGIGVAGWLLFDRAAGTAERVVFIAGVVFLIAGTGAYLGSSPLLAGCVAALVWARAPGPADRIGDADLRPWLHPLFAVLLVFAGARMRLDLSLLWVAAAILLLRLAARLSASLAVAPLLRVPPAVVASALLPPGVMGIALVLNARQVLGDAASLVVSSVTAAMAVTEIVAVFLPDDAEEAE